MSIYVRCNCDIIWQVGMKPPCPMHGPGRDPSVLMDIEEDDRRAEEAIKAFIRGDFD